ncbi:lipid hydroperoxide peroxidase [Streptococcus mitis 13/39]|uniref:Lipid hydroperoxide peroxidase n=1 Tax=Streptococcus mitis 13/39 TaxID=1239793 RepID=R0MAQ9_STRMT|nr:lipid hydroperoxide peroxidase [Streptococcus mitis 13/39]
MEEKRLEYPMVTFLGNPVSFTGKQLQVGDKALDFSLTTTDLSKKSLADFDGKKKVLSVVLLSIQASAQLKRVVLMKNWLDWTTQSY